MTCWRGLTAGEIARARRECVGARQRRLAGPVPSWTGVRRARYAGDKKTPSWTREMLLRRRDEFCFYFLLVVISHWKRATISHRLVGGEGGREPSRAFGNHVIYVFRNSRGFGGGSMGFSRKHSRFGLTGLAGGCCGRISRIWLCADGEWMT